MTTVLSMPKRRRGAQPGNSNRRIHGYYARDTRQARARLKLVTDQMYAGLETFRYIAARLADLKRSAQTNRKKRQIDDRMTLVYFEVCAEARKMAAEAGFDPFERAAAPTASNAPPAPPAHSNRSESPPPPCGEGLGVGVAPPLAASPQTQPSSEQQGDPPENFPIQFHPQRAPGLALL